MLHLTPEIRKHIYSVAIAFVPLLVTLGVLTGDVAAHILNITAALLAVGSSALARANVAASLPEEADDLEAAPADE
jgi:hypothetical protein